MCENRYQVRALTRSPATPPDLWNFWIPFFSRSTRSCLRRRKCRSLWACFRSGRYRRFPGLQERQIMAMKVLISTRTMKHTVVLRYIVFNCVALKQSVCLKGKIYRGLHSLIWFMNWDLEYILSSFKTFIGGNMWLERIVNVLQIPRIIKIHSTFHGPERVWLKSWH